MRLTVPILLFLIVFCMCLESQAQIDPESIVGVWLFDVDPANGVRDSSGNDHNGEINGNVKWVNGKFGGALEFPGQSGNLVSIPPTPDLDLVNYTIVFWYKGEDTGSSPLTQFAGPNHSFCRS